IYNESYSMWGGNTLSTMAGQFAHVYAFCFLFLALGFLYEGLKEKRLSIWGVLFLSAVALSHAYVFLIVPVFFACFFVFAKRSEWASYFKILVAVGVLSLLLSMWFIYPMIDNNKWTTPLPMVWGFNGILESFTSAVVIPVWVALAVCLVLIWIRPLKIYRKTIVRHLIFWMVPTLVYCGLFFVFPKIGLVDARAIPQVQLFLCVLVGYLAGAIFEKLVPRFVGVALVLPLLLGMVWWADAHVFNFPNWAKWNYESWPKKRPYLELMKMMASMRPGFSEPRVVFEHNDISNQSGTIRVFEMLPYFASRSTTESLYTQASILSPEAFHLQAEVSMTPSCPFRDFRCPQRSFATVRQKFDLLAVDHLIAITDETNQRATNSGFLNRVGNFGPWTLYKSIDNIRYAKILKGQARVIPYDKNWRQEFYSWFDNYSGEENWLVANMGNDPSSFVQAIKNNQIEDCEIFVKMDFFGFDFKTSCPGVPHLIKVAYHDNLKAQDGSPAYLVSPGMIGFVPQSNETRFTFGESIGWNMSVWLSWLCLFGLIFIRIRKPELLTMEKR
ncbi:MAG: hypothetical protein KDD25_07175, partial [Bdellovibrionales bacterium]|nr:hypothetical protein [Bdellovibrionales bacterium]